MFKRKVDQNILGRSRCHYSCELDNAIYEGDILHYKKDGIGMLIHDDGSVYFGGFYLDCFHGEGIAMFPTGGMLYSMFEKGKPNGFFASAFQGAYSCGYLSQGKLNGRNYLFCPGKKSWVFSEFSNGNKIRDISEEPSNSEANQSSFLQRDAFLSEKFSNFLTLKIDSIFKKNVNRSFSLLECKENPNFRCVGFVDTQNQILNGIGCVISSSSVQVSKFVNIQCFHLYYSQQMSGRYSNGSMQGLGRVTHQNGDIYDGFFRNDQLEGQGIYFSKKQNQFVYADFKNNQCANIHYQGYDYPAQVSRKMKAKVHQRSIYYMNGKVDFSSIGLSVQTLFQSLSEPASQNNLNQKQESEIKMNQKSIAKQGLEELILTPSDFQKIELKSPFKISPKQKLINEFKRDISPDYTQTGFNQLNANPLEKTPPKARGTVGFDTTIKSSFVLSSEKSLKSPSRRIFPDTNQNGFQYDRSPESQAHNRSSSSVRFSDTIPRERKLENSLLSDQNRKLVSNNFSPILNDSARISTRSPLKKKYQPIFQKDENKKSQTRISLPSSSMSRSRNSSSNSLRIPNEQNTNQPFLNKLNQLTDNFAISSSTAQFPKEQQSVSPQPNEPNPQNTLQSQLNQNNIHHINSPKYFSPEFKVETLKDVMRTLRPQGNQINQQENNFSLNQTENNLRIQQQGIGATTGSRNSAKQF